MTGVTSRLRSMILLCVIWNVVSAIRRSRFAVNPWFWTAIRGLTFIPNEVIEQESDG